MAKDSNANGSQPLNQTTLLLRSVVWVFIGGSGLGLASLLDWRIQLPISFLVGWLILWFLYVPVGKPALKDDLRVFAVVLLMSWWADEFSHLACEWVTILPHCSPAYLGASSFLVPVFMLISMGSMWAWFRWRLWKSRAQ